MCAAGTFGILVGVGEDRKDVPLYNVEQTGVAFAIFGVVGVSASVRIDLIAELAGQTQEGWSHGASCIPQVEIRLASFGVMSGFGRRG